MADANTSYATLLKEAETAYCENPDALLFAPFPRDTHPQDVPVFHTPSLPLLQADAAMPSNRPALRDAIVEAGPHGHWRETYKGTDIGQDFLDRFGCYSIIGAGGPFNSSSLWMWMVYMPAHLYYTWHHHPAEEMYIVVGGTARFMREGEPDEWLQSGDTSFHKSNQPHAMETGTDPVYVGGTGLTSRLCSRRKT